MKLSQGEALMELKVKYTKSEVSFFLNGRMGVIFKY